MIEGRGEGGKDIEDDMNTKRSLMKRRVKKRKRKGKGLLCPLLVVTLNPNKKSQRKMENMSTPSPLSPFLFKRRKYSKSKNMLLRFIDRLLIVKTHHGELLRLFMREKNGNGGHYYNFRHTSKEPKVTPSSVCSLHLTFTIH